MKNLNWLEISSTNIASFANNGTDLIIKFKSGAVYRYIDVDIELYKGFIGAESKGRYLNTHIKPVCEVEKIEELSHKQVDIDA